ncbi:PepSY-associated TM helix domain-containing protein [Xenophilus arseniciresistens]|uniref:PepSY-associated TM helix domain-containing protein n=1 Tax=Xenophilus arseniciresistens TaxID=1283306 RepID=A0AAE3SY84_9BURK|nr:PepSY-associated TM helix domain-containing protein [Xenophilus arseniciresistens]MDA7415759.1 PepSY-associated TM helix domain-containing protein [Xenophilus arseniciresistens]
MRAFWLKQLHTWHWISAALSLAGMLLFAITGFTLNHAGWFSATPSSQVQRATLPAPLQATLQALPKEGEQPLPPAMADWVRQQFGADVRQATAEADADELFLSQSLPGGEASLRIEREGATAIYTRSSRGWVAYFNDLHKGRHTGGVWSAFIDVLALSCIVFTLTGLALLWMHGRTRPLTWPLTGLSLLAPVLIALLFIHG